MEIVRGEQIDTYLQSCCSAHAQQEILIVLNHTVADNYCFWVEEEGRDPISTICCQVVTVPACCLIKLKCDSHLVITAQTQKTGNCPKISSFQLFWVLSVECSVGTVSTKHKKNHI